jgi:hypothetical protein
MKFETNKKIVYILLIIMQIFEQVSYDPEVDACYIKISNNKVCDSEMKKNWLIVDKDKD